MKSLTLYPLSDNKQEDVSKQVGQENTEEIPEHQRSIARTDGREDEDYNSDVENLT